MGAERYDNWSIRNTAKLASCTSHASSQLRGAGLKLDTVNLPRLALIILRRHTNTRET